MNQAIRPDAFVDYRVVIEQSKKTTEDAGEIEQRQLASLANSDGWVVLHAYIKDLETELGNINKTMMERGASFEDIGKNAVIVQLAQELLTKIVQKVDDANDAINKRG